jgi:flagellin-specific chaperone FliS
MTGSFGGAAAALALESYRSQQTTSAAPGQLLLQLYDHAIAGALRQDQRQVNAALVELIGALNFDYEEIAVGLFKLYDWCMRRARAKDWDEVLKILRDLRDAWARAVAGQT